MSSVLLSLNISMFAVAHLLHHLYMYALYLCLCLSAVGVVYSGLGCQFTENIADAVSIVRACQLLM